MPGMKKGIVIILAVAIIGILGIYGKSHSSTASTGSPDAADANTTDMAAAMANDSTTTSGLASNTSNTSGLRDGTFSGASENTPYGSVRIAVVISGGKISNVNFLQMPSDLGHTQEVTAMSEPLLKAETLRSQNSHIDFISGATSTTEGYIQSLQSALDQAAIS